MENIENINSDILNAFKQVLPYLPYFFEDEVSIALTDRVSFIENQASKSLPLKAEKGDLVPNTGAAAKALKLNQVVVQEVSKEVYGVPFKSYAVPLKNKQGETVGSVLVARSIERSKKLNEMAQSLAMTFQKVNEATKMMAKDIQDLSATNQEITKKSKQVAENTKGTKEVVTFIQKVSTQSNLLGLNASIEAARAGEAGKGFQVVAEEIRKMSFNTTESIKKVDGILCDIRESVETISSQLAESDGVFLEQISGLKEITESMNQLAETVQVLEEVSKSL